MKHRSLGGRLHGRQGGVEDPDKMVEVPGRLEQEGHAGTREELGERPEGRRETLLPRL